MIETKITKSVISKSLREIETKGGGMVLNFSTNKKNNGNFVGKTDYEIIYKNVHAMIELKIGNDKLTQRQIDYGKRICEIGNPTCFYAVIGIVDYLFIKDFILGQKLNYLKQMQESSYKYLLEEEKRLQELQLKRQKKVISH